MAIKRGTKEHARASVNKRTKGQVESDEIFIAELYAKGKSHQEITQALNAARPYTLSRPLISNQIKDILEGWRLHTIQEIGQQRAEELIRLNRIEVEAWTAWERSKLEGTRSVAEKRDGDDKNKSKSLARLIKEGRDGDPRFLAIVGNCIQERCKLLGLYAATKSELTGADGTPLPIPSLPAPIVNVIIEESADTGKRLALFNGHGRN